MMSMKVVLAKVGFVVVLLGSCINNSNNSNMVAVVTGQRISTAPYSKWYRVRRGGDLLTRCSKTSRGRTRWCILELNSGSRGGFRSIQRTGRRRTKTTSSGRTTRYFYTAANYYNCNENDGCMIRCQGNCTPHNLTGQRDKISNVSRGTTVKVRCPVNPNTRSTRYCCVKKEQDDDDESDEGRIGGFTRVVKQSGNFEVETANKRCFTRADFMNCDDGLCTVFCPRECSVVESGNGGDGTIFRTRRDCYRYVQRQCTCGRDRSERQCAREKVRSRCDISRSDQARVEDDFDDWCDDRPGSVC